MEKLKLNSTSWTEINNKDINIKKPTIFNLKENIDAIFVLSGGLNKEGLCHPWVIRRLNLAYILHISTNKPIICSGGGTYHKPSPINKNKYIIHESTSCAEYLINLGVDPKMIYKEWSSYDTIANGFFGFSNYFIPLKLKSIILITSTFHIKRAKEIFEWMKKIFNYNLNIKYFSISDENLDQKLIETRKINEIKSLNKLKKNLITNINNIIDFHKWFFTEHNAYRSNSELIRNIQISNEIKKTY